ncbi:helix-turn-helix domain-containing protein, partial [Roseomonas mucosa]
RHTICHSVRMSASQNDTLNAISAAQVRAARALIGWTRDQLATASDVPMRTVARFEMGEGTPQRRTLTAIRAALEAAGVEFIPENGGGAGVRMKQRQSELPGVTIGC